MLKGKKVILVGDHHQLPPLLGDDTLEETLKAMLEEDPNFEGAQELKICCVNLYLSAYLIICHQHISKC